MLLIDLLFQAPHGIEILGEFLLILLPQFPVHRLGSAQHGVENAAMSLQSQALLFLCLGGLLKEELAIHRGDIDRGHLHSGARETGLVGFLHLQRHRRIARGRSDELGRPLVHADVSFGET